MSTQVTYTNELGSIITPQQRNSLTNYNKLTYISGNLKIIESYEQSRNISYRTVRYFMDETEDKNIILQQNSDVTNNASCIVYFNKQETNGFNLWDWESYSKKGHLYFKGKEVYDSQSRLIFTCSFDLVTNQLQDGAFKNYYGNQFENPSDVLLLEFTYKSSGDVDLIFDCNGNYGHTKSISLNEFLADTQFSQQQFPWDQHEYYHAITPYLPTGNL
ncbi:hypothetical protein SAMN05428975_4457 [Mucilaginibacter sp. OK268]|uniref:hypothetical protein n=1 Tax=Mucilaginibacter sp. OK268 TaxID=1881048 RepID=UPI0008852139|nr:hypothetical protein [Mucilaginibacter sp. OK268]SDP97646.1 hypothetical protein SAMN05428975_4457 [Mucilaginibacter sp. OK268]